jgi:hypothetical protein
MKIIEAMKEIEDNQRKVDDLMRKIKIHCVDIDLEDPVYGSQDKQRAQIDSWLQSCHDLLARISKLKVAIQRTNLNTQVTIELGGKEVTKCIAEWIVRRGGKAKTDGLAKREQQLWECLTDRKGEIPHGRIKTTAGEERDIKMRRYYDPAVRDKKVDLFKSEPLLIDAKLEVVNATTNLME